MLFTCEIFIQESSNDYEDNQTRNRGFSKRGSKDHILEQFVLKTEVKLKN